MQFWAHSHILQGELNVLMSAPACLLPAQVEAHHPGGVKEIVFPDGSLRKVLPDGRELAITALHLSPEIQQPAPQL